MSLALALHILGALAVLGTGSFGLWRPDAFAGALSIGLRDDEARSAFRAVFGGAKVALALFSLWVLDDLVFAAIGAAYLGAAGARWIDLVRGARQRGVFAGVVIDATIAVLLLFPA